MPKSESRKNYPHFLEIPTRWMDNDIYGHVNNVVYYSYVDTVANEYLIRYGGFDIHNDPIVGVAVESHCNFFRQLVFPEVIEAGLRVGHLGNSSVRYEIGLFSGQNETACATAHFIHVFVERATNTPVPIPNKIRQCLQKIKV